MMPDDVNETTIHPAVQRFFTRLDTTTRLVRQAAYTGSNPALRAVYPSYRASIIVMGVIAAVIIVFGALVPIESSAVAKAHVVVVSNHKIIQHLEGGIVRRILVKEGDTVTLNQPLIELSDIAPKANRTMIESELYLAKITSAGLTALRDDQNDPQMSPDVERAIASDPNVARMATAQSRLMHAERDTFAGKQSTLELRMTQTREEINGLQAQVESATGQIALIDDEIATLEKLMAKGLSTKPHLLELKREKQKLFGDRGQAMSAIAKANQNISETQMQILTEKNDFALQNATALKESEAKVADLDEKLRTASDIVSRTVLTSPSEGVVTGLKFHTEGGVVAPGADIMDIVPKNEKLVIDAKIRPVDIGIVTPGLDARIVFSAFKARSLPWMEGKVTQLSADSFTEAKSPADDSYYTARIEVDASHLGSVASQVKLYPGMPVEVYIRTGKRSFLGYIFAPITESLHRAFRED